MRAMCCGEAFLAWYAACPLVAFLWEGVDILPVTYLPLAMATTLPQTLAVHGVYRVHTLLSILQGDAHNAAGNSIC